MIAFKQFFKNLEFKDMLGLIVTVVWLYVHIYCLSSACDIDKELVANFNIIEAMIISYYFGSSYGSNKKDNLLEDANKQIGLKNCKDEYE